MKTTKLKHKQVTTIDFGRVYTDEERAQERIWIEEQKKNDPCAKLQDVFEAIDDMDSPEYQAAEAEYEHCYFEKEMQRIQKMHPESILSGAMDWILTDWIDALFSPGQTFDNKYEPERMDARRFSLMMVLPGYADRDHIHLNIESSVVRDVDRGFYESWDRNATTFTVHVGGRVIARGKLHSEPFDKQIAIVSLREGTQQLADTVLAAITDIDPWNDWPLDLYAHFAKLGKCHQCNRPLTDHVSKVLQYGPTCAANIGLEHSQRMAEKVIAIQKAKEPATTHIICRGQHFTREQLDETKRLQAEGMSFEDATAKAKAA